MNASSSFLSIWKRAVDSKSKAMRFARMAVFHLSVELIRDLLS
jgi:hypothetical protein